MSNGLPTIGVNLGDPAGIGPEVVARALTDLSPDPRGRPIVIGGSETLRRALAQVGSPLEVRPISKPADARFESGVIDALEVGEACRREFEPARVTKASGEASRSWLVAGAELARAGEIDAVAMAPVHDEALALAGFSEGAEVFGRGMLLALLSGPLRVVHVFDHVSLRDVCERISSERVRRAIETTHASLERFGVRAPRIGVAGLNPHAKGEEEREAIAPAVEVARASGIDASGPVPPDSVFRQGIEGRYDVVLAMFHDQGHIAIKTWGFAGNCAWFVGAPCLFLTVGHGTAYDLVGRGEADHRMMRTALRQAASLAAGRGFVDEDAGSA